MRTPMLIGCALFAISLAAHSQDRLQSTGSLDVKVAGQGLSLDEERQLSIKFWLQQLMLSALYRDVVQDSSLGEWQQQLSSGSRIHCTYSGPATLAIPERRTLTFTEALVSPTGGYSAYISIRRGTHVLRLEKYDPWVFQKLVSEAGILLAPSPPAVERGLF